MAKEISERFNNNFRDFWTYLKNEITARATGGDTTSVGAMDRLTSINGFGPVLQQALVDFVSNKEVVAQVEGLLKVLSLESGSSSGKGSVKSSGKSAGASSALAGRKVVFTGAFECGITRKQAQDMCVELGELINVILIVV